MDNRDLYIQATFRLSRISPDAWTQFVEAVQAYASSSCVNSVKSPPELLVRNTARASALLDLAEDFKTINDLNARVENKQSRQQNGR